MPDSQATTSANEAMRMLGKFMEEHAPHGCHSPVIDAEGIILLCEAHSPPAYEVIEIDMVRAMGAELSEQGAVSF